MRIGINTLFDNPRTGTGGVTYLRNLVLGLAQVDRENEYLLFVSPLSRELFPNLPSNFSFVPCPFSKERRLATVLFEHTRLPFLIRQHGIDVFHSPGNIAPIRVPCASVVTLHTMRHYVLPETTARTARFYRRLLMPLTARRADAVIAISDWVRDFLVENLRVDPEKILRVYEGVELPGSDGQSRVEGELPQNFILFISALWPHKNAHRLIEAMGVLRREYGHPHTLVIVGNGWDSYRRELEDIVNRLGLRDAVKFAGRVPDVFEYYRAADVFVYPSLHEEFGLPLLEAMACGTPVVTASKGSLPEIAGDAALVVNCADPRQIASAVNDLVTNAKLREDLIKRGRERAAMFTWRKTAEGTLQAYQLGYERWRRSRGWKPNLDVPRLDLARSETGTDRVVPNNS